MTDPTKPRDTLRRALTFEEQSTWGKCPVCEAEHGESCRRVDGRPMRPGDGAHLARLNAAPRHVRLVACS